MIFSGILGSQKEFVSRLEHFSFSQISHFLSLISENKVILGLKVGLERFELSTFRLSAERSSQTELQAHKHIIKSSIY
jgi:hypothetical protein